jgi:hypothetical protein
MSSPAEVKARLEAERRGVPFLLYRDGDDAEVIVPLTAALTVGRRADRDVSLAWDTEVSRLHAQLESIGNDWVVVDDGLSLNGTFVNGERVNGRRRLRDGDRLVFGDTPVLFRAPAQADVDSTDVIAAGGTNVLLSEGQRKVLVALCRPLKDSPYAAPATNRAIAGDVHLSVDAVKAHLRVLFDRFGIDHLPQNQKRARLAAVALVSGVVRQHEL